MKERRKGNIITVSSTAGRRPHECSPIPHAAAEGAAAYLTSGQAAWITGIVLDVPGGAVMI